MNAGRDGGKVQNATELRDRRRLAVLLYVVSIGWVGIWMPCKVLAWLWSLRPLVGAWEEIIPLCFLITISVGMLIRLGRKLLTRRASR